MLDIEAQKNIYDKLIKEDIIVYLLNANLNFDYFISTDVFRLKKSRNETVGKLAFSTENFDYNLRHFETQNLRKEKNQYIRGSL